MILIMSHLLGNGIAYLALFVALGGTSYAAINLPRNSVGTAQLRNGSVTPPKMNHGLIGGYVRAWAITNNGCQLVASSGGARIANDHPCTNTGGALIIIWRGRFPRSPHACVAMGIPSSVPGNTDTAVEGD